MATPSIGKAPVEALTYDLLREALESGAAALRCRRKLQPAGGEGDKVFPPTYLGGVYAVEQRRVAGRNDPVTCVLLDSVQSQANRMEEALQEAYDAGEIALPMIAVDFTPWEPTGDEERDEREGRLLSAVGRVTSLQAPHRLADAILRDSTYNGVPFRKSEIGRPINYASARNATAVYRLCPTALLFGMWDSTGPKGGLGAKFERAVVAEVVGVGAALGTENRGVRRDPLEASKEVQLAREADGSWKVAEGKGKGTIRPSEVNHGSVPFEGSPGGATVEYAEQTLTISLAALRRLRFPVNQPKPHQGAADAAGWVVLAALGLLAAERAFRGGGALRSRCLLFPEAPLEWELLSTPGEAQPRAFRCNAAGANKVFEAAVKAAATTGLTWGAETLELEPSVELRKLVRLSQEENVKKGAEE